jgi:hypothetical protein
MNDPLQIEEAGIRYRTGAMGHLAPLSYPDPGPAARI